MKHFKIVLSRGIYLAKSCVFGRDTCWKTCVLLISTRVQLLMTSRTWRQIVRF